MGIPYRYPVPNRKHLHPDSIHFFQVDNYYAIHLYAVRFLWSMR